LNLHKALFVAIATLFGCGMDSSGVGPSESNNVMCAELGTTCTAEYDTACAGKAVCKCGFWMHTETAKVVACPPPRLPPQDSGAETIAPESGTAETAADAPDTSPADTGTVADTVSSDSGPTDTGLTDTGLADTGSDSLADSVIVADSSKDGEASVPSDTGSIVVDTGSVTDSMSVVDTVSSDASPTDTSDAGPSDTGSDSLADSDAVADSNKDSEASVPSDTGSIVADTGSTSDSMSVADTGTVADTVVSSDAGPADTGAADSGADTTTVSGVGTLVVRATVPRWGALHPITAYAYVHMTGGSPSPGKWTATGRSIVITTDAVAGSSFVFNGFYDPKTTTKDDWTYAFCDWKTITPRVALWATFNGKPTARVKAVPNLTGGCNLEVVAAASPLISTTDKDGDGFSPTDSDLTKRDCDDDPVTGHHRFPSQIETPEDDVDMDCDGFKDPPRAIIRMKGVAAGKAPLVYDVIRWGTTFPMSFDSPSGSYQTSPLEMEIAPSVFFINWSGGGWDSSYESGVCKELTGGVVMYRDTDKTLIPVTLKLASSGASCHRFAEF